MSEKVFPELPPDFYKLIGLPPAPWTYGVTVERDGPKDILNIQFFDGKGEPYPKTKGFAAETAIVEFDPETGRVARIRLWTPHQP